MSKTGQQRPFCLNDDLYARRQIVLYVYEAIGMPILYFDRHEKAWRIVGMLSLLFKFPVYNRDKVKLRFIKGFIR